MTESIFKVKFIMNNNEFSDSKPSRELLVPRRKCNVKLTILITGFEVKKQKKEIILDLIKAN